MTDLLHVLGATLGALGIVGAVVFGGQDATYFVPPPEAVAESFARNIASRHYDRAVRYAHGSSGITEMAVSLAGERLHARADAIDNVVGEPGAISGNNATASAVLITEGAGRVRYGFRLVRTRHLWMIAEWFEP